MSSPSRAILLTAEAEDDFEDIRLYSRQQWGEQQEAAYTAALLRALTAIGDHPEIGRGRVDLGADIRSYAARQHIIYYRLTDTAVIILRILHRRTDAHRALREADE